MAPAHPDETRGDDAAATTSPPRTARSWWRARRGPAADATAALSTSARAPWWPWWVALAGAEAMLAVVAWPAPGGDPVPLAAAMLLCAAPWGLAGSLSTLLGRIVGYDGLTLRIPDRSMMDARVLEVVEVAWCYEKDRYRRSLVRAESYAMAFGTLATLLLTGAATLVLAGPHLQAVAGIAAAGGGSGPTELAIALSLSAAVFAGFLIGYVRIIVRLSSQEISARAFAWSAHSLVLIAVADLGLLLMLQTWSSPAKAVLLGIFVGLVGEQAVRTLVDKAPRVLGLGGPAEVRSASPLLGVMAPEHVERLREEGIISIHDLALVPTARLFFNTPYGLPKICDWQDAALLQVLVGSDSARDLENRLGIRTATQLRDLAGQIGDPARAKEAHALRVALRLTEDGPFRPILESVANDEVLQRLEVHRRAVVHEPAYFERPSPATARPEEAAAAARDGAAAPTTGASVH
jgi:hypothetical protein